VVMGIEQHLVGDEKRAPRHLLATDQNIMDNLTCHKKELIKDKCI
jgi:hypothetical protein